MSITHEGANAPACLPLSDAEVDKRLAQLRALNRPRPYDTCDCCEEDFGDAMTQDAIGDWLCEDCQAGTCDCA